LEFAIGIVALAVCGIGIGLVMADVFDTEPVPISVQASTTTTTMINSSVIVPETTASPAVTQSPVTVTKKPIRVTSKSQIGTTTSIVRAPTTTTTQTPNTPLEIARAEVGKTGPYAEGGFWCAQFVSWVAEQAKVEGWQSNDSPARLHTIAKEQGRLTDTPLPGYLVFIDLTGKNNANEYISHVGIVESVEGTVIHTIEGNADSSGLVTRQTREIGDGYVIDFAPFSKGEQ
jgi:hypothetical protein